MKDWEEKKLGEVCKFIGGSQPSKSFFSFDEKENFIRLIQIRDYKSDKNIVYIPKDKAKRFCDENDIMIGRYGPPVFQILKGLKGAYNVALMKAVPNEKYLSKEYAFAFLKYSKIQDYIIHLSQRAAGQTGVNKEAIEDYPVLLPPLQEQQRIVAILDEAFIAIDKAKANTEQNLKNAKELFETYRQNIFKNPKDNWKKKRWGDLCDFVRGPFGGSLKKSIFKEEGYVVYEQKHAIHDHFNQLRYFIDEEKFNEMKRFELFPGDIIMSCSGATLGRVAIVPEGIPKGIINQALLKLTPKKNVSINYIKHWLRSKIFQDIIVKYSGGAAIPNVPSAKILKDIEIPAPSLEIQERVAQEIDIVLEQTKKLEAVYEKKLQDLEELKKSVLSKAFSGEL